MSPLSTSEIGCREVTDASASAAGCEIEVKDHASYVPMVPNEQLAGVFAAAVADLGVPMEFDPKTPDVKSGATDQGNVCFTVPAIHPNYDIGAPVGATNHTEGFTKATGTLFAFERTLVVGQALGQSAWAILTDDELATNVSKAFEATVLKRRQYITKEEEWLAVTIYNEELSREGASPASRVGKCTCNHD